MASLVGQQLKDTYDSLLKTSDNDALGGTYKEITDGSGNGSNLYLGTGGRVGIGATSPSFNLSVGNNAFGLNFDSGINRLSLRQTNSTSHSVALSSVGNAVVESSTSGTGAGFIQFNTLGSEAMRIDSSGRVGIGETNPFGLLHLTGDTNSNGAELFLQVNNNNTTDNLGAIHFGNNVDETLSSILSGTSGANNSSYLTFSTSSAGSQSEAMRIDSSGNVGIGTTSPSATLNVNKSTIGEYLYVGSGGIRELRFSSFDTASPHAGHDINASSSNGVLTLSIGGSEAMRIDSSGNVFVGKTTTSVATEGVELFPNDRSSFTRDGGFAILINRLTSDGDLITFRKDGSTVGSIGSVLEDSLSRLYIAQSDTGLKFNNGPDYIVPCTGAGADRDDVIDLGSSSARFTDIYATNATIQTSDRNEKQDIEELDDAELRVAQKAKTLLRKFRWKSSVAENENARVHFGIIAQDLEQAFIDEGLDAGRYGMFIKSTWANEQGEEQTRLGVRYNQLLAFIISAI